MNSNVALLNYIYQNAEMGKDSTEELIKECKDDDFKVLLEKIFNEFKRIFELSESKILSANEDPKNLSTFSKISTEIMLDLKTLTNKSSSHLAEMMIQGATMGIIDITKKLNEYNDASQETLNLGNELLKFEQDSIDELKKFLR